MKRQNNIFVAGLNGSGRDIVRSNVFGKAANSRNIIFIKTKAVFACWRKHLIASDKRHSWLMVSFKGIADQILDIYMGIRQLVHKGRTRAIFQNPAHKIGQQITMTPHRRIYAYRG